MFRDETRLDYCMCRAYHAGDKLFVEVDIVMNRDTPPCDIGESLQDKLESRKRGERPRPRKPRGHPSPRALKHD